MFNRFVSIIVMCVKQQRSDELIYCGISGDVPADYIGEDLSFLLDSKGPVQLQYSDTYGELKDQSSSSKGTTFIPHTLHLTIFIVLPQFS